MAKVLKMKKSAPKKMASERPPVIHSGFGILDVTDGRDDLKSVMDAGKRVPITITGYIDHVHGHDDGVSREFTLDIQEIKLGSPEKR